MGGGGLERSLAERGLINSRLCAQRLDFYRAKTPQQPSACCRLFSFHIVKGKQALQCSCQPATNVRYRDFLLNLSLNSKKVANARSDGSCLNRKTEDLKHEATFMERTNWFQQEIKGVQLVKSNLRYSAEVPRRLN